MSLNLPTSSSSCFSRLTVGEPVVIKNPFSPEGQFGIEFLQFNYRIPSVTPVDIHDCLSGETGRYYLQDFSSISKNQTRKRAIRMLPVTSTRYFSEFTEELDDCYRVAWGNCVPHDLEARDKPLQIDHNRHFLQLFQWGYHHFSTRAPEGMACCMRVLIGTITLVVSDVENLIRNYGGREMLFDCWHKSNIRFVPGDAYERYMATSLCIVVLKAADTIIFPPGTFYELYAATDAMVATNYFYMLHTLPLTEFSRRYDTLFIEPKEHLRWGAYVTLSRLMCNLPFSDVSVQLNAILALCSMVINPAYYTHHSSSAQDESRRLQAAARRYLCIVDPFLNPKVLDKSLKLHAPTPIIPPAPLYIEVAQFDSFSYPLKHDVEWALEYARLVEKYVGKNSQQFTVHADGFGHAVFNGTDFFGVSNYSWNPKLDLLGKDLKDFHIL